MTVSFLLFFNSFPISWKPPILKLLLFICWFFLLPPVRMLNFNMSKSCMNTELLLIINMFEFVKIAKKIIFHRSIFWIYLSNVAVWPSYISTVWWNCEVVNNYLPFYTRFYYLNEKLLAEWLHSPTFVHVSNYFFLKA